MRQRLQAVGGGLAEGADADRDAREGRACGQEAEQGVVAHGGAALEVDADRLEPRQARERALQRRAAGRADAVAAEVQHREAGACGCGGDHSGDDLVVDAAAAERELLETGQGWECGGQSDGAGRVYAEATNA